MPDDVSHAAEMSGLPGIAEHRSNRPVRAQSWRPAPVLTIGPRAGDRVGCCPSKESPLAEEATFSGGKVSFTSATFTGGGVDLRFP